MKNFKETAVLLSNASATGVGVGYGGGDASVDIVVGAGGATIAVQKLGPDNSTWLPIATLSTTTSGSFPIAALGAGQYRGTVTGGTTPSGIYVSIVGATIL